MYVRFIVCEPGSRRACGIFRPNDFIDSWSQPDWLREQLEEHYVWFNDRLPIPRGLRAASRTRKLRSGLCWFTLKPKSSFRAPGNWRA
jgi:hypothetical protein